MLTIWLICYRFDWYVNNFRVASFAAHLYGEGGEDGITWGDAAAAAGRAAVVPDVTRDHGQRERHHGRCGYVKHVLSPTLTHHTGSIPSSVGCELGSKYPRTSNPESALYFVTKFASSTQFFLRFNIWPQQSEIVTWHPYNTSCMHFYYGYIATYGYLWRTTSSIVMLNAGRILEWHQQTSQTDPTRVINARNFRH